MQLGLALLHHVGRTSWLATWRGTPKQQDSLLPKQGSWGLHPPHQRGLGSSWRMLSPSQAEETTAPGPDAGKSRQTDSGHHFSRGGGARLTGGRVAACPLSRMESLLWQQPGHSFSQHPAGMLEEATGVTQELNWEREQYCRKVRLIRVGRQGSPPEWLGAGGGTMPSLVGSAG